MSALDRLTDVKSWNHETEDYDAGLPEVKEYDGDFSDVKQAAAELASLRAERDEAVALLAKSAEKVWNLIEEIGAASLTLGKC